MSVDDPDKEAYDEQRKILIKCLSNIFIDNTINNKDKKGEILFNLFNTDWKKFTCGNVQPTPGKIRNQIYVRRPTNHINNHRPLRSRSRSPLRNRNRSRSPLRPTIGGKRRSTRKMKRRH